MNKTAVEDGGLAEMREACHAEGPEDVEIREGEVYVVETKSLDKAHDFIGRYIQVQDRENKKYIVNIFTRHMPVVNGHYKNVGVCGNVYEISTLTGKNRISPASLSYIKHMVSSSAFGEKKPLFVIDCIDVMGMYTEERKIWAFLEELRDIVTDRKGIGFMIIDPATYDERQLAQLKRFKSTIRL
ncbi:MAG: DUF835 domain-containing protein [Thermoplasmata archaeon]